MCADNYLSSGTRTLDNCIYDSVCRAPKLFHYGKLLRSNFAKTNMSQTLQSFCSYDQCTYTNAKDKNNVGNPYSHLPHAFFSSRCRAERGLSNYLLFERAKQDPKIAAAAAKLVKFEDDADGNLVRISPDGLPIKVPELK